MRSLFGRVYKEKSARESEPFVKIRWTVKSVTTNVINAATMNKIAIIAGEIATGPGLGSSSVIINKIRQPRVRRPRVTCARSAAAGPQTSQHFMPHSRHFYSTKFHYAARFLVSFTNKLIRIALEWTNF